MDHDSMGFKKIPFEITQSNNLNELQILKELYDGLYRNNPQPMFINNVENLMFLDANNAALEFYGYTAEEIQKLSIKDIRPSEDVQQFLNHLALPQHKKNAGVWRHKKKNGEITFVNIRSHDIKFVDTKARHVMVSDVSSIHKFRELFHSHSAVKLLLDAENGNIVDANESASKFYGWSQEQLIGMNISEINTLPSETILENINKV